MVDIIVSTSTSDETTLDLRERCYFCGDLIEVDETHDVNCYEETSSWSSHLITICTSCKDMLRTCNSCGNFLGRYFEGDVCPDCGYVCEGCNCCVSDANELYRSDIDEYSYYCCNCQDDLYYCFNCDGYYSSECSCQDKDSHHIHSYSYKPNPHFFGKGPLYLGVELEVECFGSWNPDEVAEKILTKVNGCDTEQYIYCKEDSSIDNGVEIVTHPMSFQWIKDNENLFNDLSAMLRKLKTYGYKSGRAGMHIHLSRKAFSNLHLYKMKVWSINHRKFIFKLSQRSENSFNEWAWPGEKCYAIKGIKNRHSYMGCRSEAINLTSACTVELRVFRSSTAQDSFWRKVEFAQALYEFTKVISIKVAEDSEIDSFQMFVNQNHRKFPHLKEWLDGKSWFNLLKKEG
jgi:hypothetical protein